MVKFLCMGFCFALALSVCAGCFQAHSDDSLRSVPVTNNPHIIQDSNKTPMIPGMGY